jgi:hypothetical protein
VQCINLGSRDPLAGIEALARRYGDPLTIPSWEGGVRMTLE